MPTQTVTDHGRDIMRAGQPHATQSPAMIATTWPLLLGMGVLMLGAGLQGTLLGLRATIEGFPTPVIGVIMSCYYVGYLLGTFGCTPTGPQSRSHPGVCGTGCSSFGIHPGARFLRKCRALGPHEAGLGRVLCRHLCGG